jgi:DNA-binding MarR family transcriptional regulator
MAAPNKKRTASKREDRAAGATAFHGQLEDLIGYNLRRAHGLQKQRFATVFAAYGIRPPSLSALGTIFDHPGITQTELGKKLHMKRANIVPLLAELEGRALVERRTGSDDRRTQVVFLTPAGKRFTKEMLTLHRQLEDDLARNLGAKERDQLVQLLKKFRRLAPEPAFDDED